MPWILLSVSVSAADTTNTLAAAVLVTVTVVVDWSARKKTTIRRNKIKASYFNQDPDMKFIIFTKSRNMK